MLMWWVVGTFAIGVLVEAAVILKVWRWALTMLREMEQTRRRNLELRNLEITRATRAVIRAEREAYDDGGHA